MEENLEFSLAQELLEYTGNHVFLTGKAGTGKTTFLQKFYNTTSKNAVITAPTGVAAINAGGVTLHSMFNLPFQAYIPSLMSVGASLALNSAEIRRHFRFNKNKLKVLRNLEVLIIDEISMVRADMLDAISEALKYARRNEQPFGGVQVLMIGDLFQLPPVIKQEEWPILSQFYTSPYFFDAKIMEQIKMVNVELKNIYRQTDGNFISILNDIRNNDLDEYNAQLLNERYFPNFENEEKIITLTTHNRQADELNAKNLKEINEKSYGFYAEIDGNFPESAYPMPLDLELKKGAKVMFIKNDSSSDKRYYNGKIVEIIDLNEDEIWVQFDDEEKPYKLEKEEWLNKKYSVDEENEISEEVMGSFRHYPIRLAWAITIHKSQGLTFDEVVIDAEKAFAPGQVYVALSRCTQLDGLYLSSRINQRNLFLDERVLEYENNFWSANALEEVIEKEKKPYALQKLFQTLNFQQPLQLIQRWIVYTHKNPSSYKEEVSTVQIKIEKSLKELQTLGVKFRNVSLRKYQENPESEEVWQEIVERSTKAIDYFLIEYTTKIMQPFSSHIDEMEKKKRTATYLKEITPYEISLQAYLEQLKRLRLLDQPLFIPPKNHEGNNKKKREKKLSQHITLELLEEGLNIEEIAIERELSRGTIEKHIIKLIEDNTIEDISQYINQNEIDKVIQELPKGYNDMKIKELREATNEKYSYFELKLAQLMN